MRIIGLPGSDLAWYVNGLLVPELYLRRELTYNFQVEGGDRYLTFFVSWFFSSIFNPISFNISGDDPHSPTHYHPLIITDEPVGGYEQMTAKQRNKTRVLAGVEFTRRGQPRPTAG